jgi:hypothetical protein
MSIPRIDIGIACSAHQIPNWWLNLFASLMRDLEGGAFELGQLLGNQSALREFNKNRDVGAVFAPATENKRNNDTDANRCAIMGSFMGGGGESGVKSEWIFWVDDDTVFPDGTITRLLRLEKPFCAGLYFNTNPPYNPIAYNRVKGGGYTHLWDYAPGSVFQVDSVGMGCTLVHRSVYEKILDNFVCYQRPNGSLFPIHKGLVTENTMGYTGEDKPEVYVENNFLHMHLVKPEPNDERMFPFYAMEYGRTEDHHFCELAAQVGIRPWVDTTIVCEHWKHAPGTYENYRKEVIKRELPEVEE